MFFIVGHPSTGPRKNVWKYNNDYSLAWSAYFGAAVGDSYMAAAWYDSSNNVLYVGGVDGDPSGSNVFKLNVTTGAKLADCVVAGGSTVRCIAQKSDGTLIVGGNDASSHGLFEVPADLSSVTSIGTSARKTYSVLVASDGNIYAAREYGYLEKWADGEYVNKTWEVDLGIGNINHLFELSNGNIVCSVPGSGDKKVSCRNPSDGSEIWTTTFTDYFINSMYIDSSDNIYVGWNETNISKLSSSDGSITWTENIGKEINWIGLLSSSDLLLAGHFSVTDNTVLWTFNVSTKALTSLEIDPFESGAAGAREVIAGTPYSITVFSPPYDIITYKRLVAVGNNEVWCEMSAGAMTKLVATTGDIDTADQLNMFEGFQKIFIVNGSNLKVADFINTKLTSEAEITSNIPSKGDLLTQAGDDPAQMSVDYIYYNAITEDHYIYGYTITGTFDTTHDVIDANSNVIISAANLSAVNEATTTPHWYDWTPYNNDTTTYGEMPNKAYLGCLYRGRCVISGNPEYPYQWYMSKVGDPWNFSYSATDALSAVAGNNADAGEIGDIVRAIIPYKDDFLIFACASSMWYLRGDPMSGGSIDSFDETVGIFGANSWCIDNAGTFYFWGTGGIYFSEIQGGVITKPNLLTGLNLPQIIKDEGVDPSTHRICMGYDRKHLGLVIIITKISDGTNSNYWYDLRTQGFFPESCPKECAGYSVFNYQANNEDYSGLLIGCKDGYIRKFDDTAKDDDIGVSDEAIDSYCTIIQPLGDNEEKEGKLTSLTITTAGGASGGDFSDTDGVSYEYHKADNAETVLENIIDGDTAFSSGTLSGTGRQNRIRKKLRGAYLGLKLYNNTANETWAVEKITGEIKPAGKIK